MGTRFDATIQNDDILVNGTLVGTVSGEGETFEDYIYITTTKDPSRPFERWRNDEPIARYKWGENRRVRAEAWAVAIFSRMTPAEVKEALKTTTPLALGQNFGLD